MASADTIAGGSSLLHVVGFLLSGLFYFIHISYKHINSSRCYFYYHLVVRIVKTVLILLMGGSLGLSWLTILPLFLSQPVSNWQFLPTLWSSNRSFDIWPGFTPTDTFTFILNTNGRFSESQMCWGINKKEKNPAKGAACSVNMPKRSRLYIYMNINN